MAANSMLLRLCENAAETFADFARNDADIIKAASGFPIETRGVVEWVRKAAIVQRLMQQLVFG